MKYVLSAYAFSLSHYSWSPAKLMFIITIHLFYFASVSNSDNNYWTIEKSNLKKVASCQCLKCPLRIFSQIRIREFPLRSGEGRNFSRLQIITLEKFSQDSFLIWTKYNFSTNNLVKFSQQYFLRINDHYGKRSILRMCKSKIGGSLNRSDKKNNISCQKGFLRPFPPQDMCYILIYLSCLTFLVWAPEVPSNSAVVEKLYWNVVFISSFLRKSAFSQKGQM